FATGQPSQQTQALRVGIDKGKTEVTIGRCAPVSWRIRAAECCADPINAQAAFGNKTFESNTPGSIAAQISATGKDASRAVFENR
ncbi:MAG: hypothetical protein ACI8W7_002134, partial [Gammaproteobacteria bacterium]